MTVGEIYTAAYKLKVFQIWQVQKQLEKDWGFLGKSYIKERVRSWIATQLRHKTLVKVNDDPTIYAFPEFANSWQNFIEKRTCEICGKEFIPIQAKQMFCSEECKKIHYRDYHEERRKKEGMKTNTKRRWTKGEIQKLIQLKNKGYTYKEIAQRLDRTKTAVEEKYKALRGVRK